MTDTIIITPSPAVEVTVTPATVINNVPGTVTVSATTAANVQVVSPIINTGTSDSPIIGINQTLLSLSKSQVGLGNVDNTSDVNKPISTATQSALDLKLNVNTASSTYLPKAGPTFTGTMNGADLILSGSLTVGTYNILTTTNWSISDSVIYLSNNQFATDALDIGFYGAYGTTGGTEANHKHTGLIRNHIDGVWNLFYNGVEPDGQTVDLTNVSYSTLKLGGLIINGGSTSNLLLGDGSTAAVNTFARTNAANAFTVGGHTITNDADVVALSIIPSGSQSVSTFRVRNSLNTSDLFSISSGGGITTASGLTVNALASFNANISAFGTTQLWANQQLALGVRNGVNAINNLVQYSKNDTTVTGGVTTNGLLWAGTTSMENNQGYSLTTSTYVSTTQATFTTNSAVTQNPFAVGQKLIITGVSGGTYNGSFIISAIGGSAGAWTATVTAPSGTTPFTNVAGTGGIGSLEPSLFIRQMSPGTPALTIKAYGTASGSTEPFRYIDSTGVVKTYMAASGDITAPAISAIWSITSSAQDVTVNAMRARTSLASGYKSNLQTWENSTTVLAGVNAAGKIFTGATIPATTTIGGTIQSIATGANPLVTMASAHGLSVGEVVTLAGTTGGTYDGSFYVATVPLITTFTITSTLTTGQASAGGTLAVPAQFTSISRNAGSVSALIRGASGQLASFVEVQANAGNTLFRVNATGYALAPLGFIGGGTSQSTNSSSVLANNTFYSTASNQIGLAVRGTGTGGSSTQSVNLQEWQTYDGTTTTAAAAVSSAGDFVSNGTKWVQDASGFKIQNNSSVTLFRSTTAGAFADTVTSYFFQIGNASGSHGIIQASGGFSLGRLLLNSPNVILDSTAYASVAVPTAAFEVRNNTGTQVASIVRGAGTGGSSTQSVELQLWQTWNGTSATTVAKIGNTGDLTAGYAYVSGLRDVNGTGAYINMQSGTSGVLLNTRATGNIGLIIDSPTGQSVDLQQWKVNGTSVASIDNTGTITAANGFKGSGLLNTSGQTTVVVSGSRNLQLAGGTLGVGGGAGVIGITNATTVPTSNSTVGGILYVDTGALKYIGTSGSAATIVNADGTYPNAYTLASGTTNGTLKLTASSGGIQDNIAVTGLGTAAYTASTAYATSSHTHGNVLNGGTMTTSVIATNPVKVVITDSSNNLGLLPTTGATNTTFLRGDGSWATPAGGGGTPFGPVIKTGYYYSSLGTDSSASVAIASAITNNLELQPFYLAATATAIRITIQVQTGTTGGVIRLGIYNNAAGGDYPGTLLLDAGTVTTATAGAKTITISQSLSAGLYWIGYLQTAGAGNTQLLGVTSNTFTGAGAGAMSMVIPTATTASFSAVQNIAWRQTGTSTLPATFAGTTLLSMVGSVWLGF